MNKAIKHPVLNVAKSVAEICHPLKILDIGYFSHVRIDKKGHFSALSSSVGFAEHYLVNKYYNADIHMAKNNNHGQYVIWDAIERYGLSEKMFQEAMAFGIDHTFTIIERDTTGDNFYHFASDMRGTSINQVYLSNIELLKLFNEKVHASKELANVYQHTFTLDQNAAGFTAKNVLPNEQESRLAFQQAIKLNKKLHGRSIKPLSYREVEILDWLHHGKTTEQIAQILTVSNVTINKHVANIKEKTGCYTQFQLGELYSSMTTSSYQTMSQVFKK
jgi:DNA-binding CsgD family transcriptional regulator